MKTINGKHFKLVYSDWYTVGTQIKPFGNGIPPIIIEFIKKIRQNNPGIDYNEMLQHEQKSKAIKFDHSEIINYFFRHYSNQIVSSKDVLDDDFIYIYPLEIKDRLEALSEENTFRLEGKEYSWFLKTILPPELLPHFKTGKVKILVNIVHDPNYDHVSMRAFEEQMQEMGIDSSNIIFVSGSKFDEYYQFYPDSKMKIYNGHLYLQQGTINMRQVPVVGQLGYVSEFVEENNLSYDIIRPYKFLCFNRTMHKPHRAGLGYLAIKYDLLSEGKFSFIQKLNKNTLRHYISKVTTPNEEYVSVLESIIPYELDTQHLPELKKSGFDVTNNKKELYLDTYIHIVTETFFGNNVFLSEKIFRPISNFQPFIVFGDYGSLAELKNLGFKTFEPFIDESYDLEIDPKERFRKIEIEIAKLKNKSIKEIHEWYYDIKDILVHNRNHLYYYYEGYECFEPIFGQIKSDYESENRNFI